MASCCTVDVVSHYAYIGFFNLHATAATAVARLINRNSLHLSVHLSITRVDQSKTMQARITKSSLLAA